MNLIRYYNQNRRKIWGIAIIIFSAFIVLQLMNVMYKINNENRLITKNSELTQINTNNVKIATNESVITGQKVDSKQLQEVTTVIDNFISYCNNKELQKAYDLLTDDCKKQMYTTLEVFEQAYYNQVFEGKSKTCSVENWINDTFKVTILEDILATGKSHQNYSKQDYITIEKVDEEYKLNINHYIGYTKIDTTTMQHDIRMEVLSKNTYMDYEEYTVKVTNNTENTILLDSGFNPKTLYLQDSKEVKYSAYSHELTEPTLTILSEQTKEVIIKFYSSYVSNKKIEFIIFSDVSLQDDQGQILEKVEFRADV